MYKFFNKKRSAFTLIELSIVIIIVSILMTGAITVAMKKISDVKYSSSKDKISKIYSALGSYFKEKGILPCPAPINVSKSSSNYGLESRTGNNITGTCNFDGTGVFKSNSTTKLFYGMIPVATLGLGSEFAEDNYGSKFAYVVNTDFTNSTNFGLAASNNSVNLIQVNDVNASGSGVAISSDAIFLIISYGDNKSGAFNSNSTTKNTISSDTDEVSNNLDSASAFDKNFVNFSARSSIFDDILFYKNRNSLISDFERFDLISCLGTTSASYSDSTVTINGTTAATWPDAKYGQVVSATNSCASGYDGSVKKPTKRCGKFGVWEPGAVNFCVVKGDGSGGTVALTTKCIGGTIATYDNKIIHTFTYVGNSVNQNFSCISNASVDYLVVGGGGGGGGYNATISGGGGGGGGGGGVVFSSTPVTVSPGQVTNVQVGGGGSGGSGTGNGTDGGDGGSSVLSFQSSSVLSAYGGKGGKKSGGNANVSASSTVSVGGASGAGFYSANAGGKGGAFNGSGGGGGGANSGAVGENAEPSSTVLRGGNGGSGYKSFISGVSTVYGCGGGGGGGGANSSIVPGVTTHVSLSSVKSYYVGGSGGGGYSNSNYTNQVFAPVAGNSNTGCGGGGGGKGNSAVTPAIPSGGAAGANGVIIISYTNT